MCKTIVIQVQYLSSAKRENVLSFEWQCEDLLLSNALCKAVEGGIQHLLIYKFDRDRFYCQDQESFVHIQFGENITRYIHNDTITLIYSEVIKPNNAKKVGECQAKNGGTIYFDIYPGEKSHRFSPHVKASVGRESIRITISDNPRFFGEERFTGNNRVNEKLAFTYVRENWKKLMMRWNEIVEGQYL